jgi:hypothetical protein
VKRIFATQLSDLDTFDKEGVGTVRQEGNKVYKYVKFVPGTATVAIVAGSAVGYKTIAGCVVTADSTDVIGSGALGAGMAVAAQAGSATLYGWVQVHGLVTAMPNAATGAAGNGLIMGTDGLLAVAAAATNNVVATMVDATASANKVFAHFPY